MCWRSVCAIVKFGDLFRRIDSWCIVLPIEASDVYGHSEGSNFHPSDNLELRLHNPHSRRVPFVLRHDRHIIIIIGGIPCSDSRVRRYISVSLFALQYEKKTVSCHGLDCLAPAT
jgi:hypothetical protein